MKDETYGLIGVIVCFALAVIAVSVLVVYAANKASKALGIGLGVASYIIHRGMLRWLTDGGEPTTACFCCGRNCDHKAGGPVQTDPSRKGERGQADG